MRSVIVIPTRMDSRRFPGKPMAMIDGVPMIVRVCEQASLSGLRVVVASPDREIAKVVTKNGYEHVMTGKCITGTDRVAEAAIHIDADIYVNVQGDEPMIDPESIRAVVSEKEQHYNDIIGSMCAWDVYGPNDVRVYQNCRQLIHMSREGAARFRQCGLYAFNIQELMAYANIPESEKAASLKRNQDIEIMRFVDLGFRVRMVEIRESQAVDTPDDIKKVEGKRNGRRSKSN